VLVVRRVRFFGIDLGPCTPLNLSDVCAPLHRQCIIGKFKNACAAPPPCVSTWRAVLYSYDSSSFIVCVWIMYVSTSDVYYYYDLRELHFSYIPSQITNANLNACARRIQLKFIACDSYAITFGTILSLVLCISIIFIFALARTFTYIIIIIIISNNRIGAFGRYCYGSMYTTYVQCTLDHKYTVTAL